MQTVLTAQQQQDAFGTPDPQRLRVLNFSKPENLETKLTWKLEPVGEDSKNKKAAHSVPLSVVVEKQFLLLLFFQNVLNLWL